jgi:hypothetical protein
MAQTLLRQFAWRRESAAAADATLLRAALMAACALSIGAAAWYGDPSGYLTADPALARLLRGMAAIKGMMALAALGAVFWRFGWPTSKGVAVVYLCGTSVLAGSTMLIWQLTAIPLAAVLFHVAALSMLVAGWRER